MVGRTNVLSRRALLGVAPALLMTARARAAAAPLKVPLLLRTLVAPADGGTPEAVVASPWIVEQLAAANALFDPFGVTFTEASARAELSVSRAEMETKGDRDGLAAHLTVGSINVFFVRSLRDVDEPSRMRMGVTWRFLRDLEKKYVIVASYAPPQVLAHELGHFLGLPHSNVKNNLMSYEREAGQPVFLDARQGAIVRRTTEALFAERKLVAPARPRSP